MENQTISNKVEEQELGEMKISEEYPPVYDAILAAGMKPTDRTVYTYWDTIYNPNKLILPEDLLVHEETHAIQQRWKTGDAEMWWARYLTDPYFRIEQEAEAYGRQLAFMKTINKDRNMQARFKIRLSTQLSSEIYGSVISQQKAAEMIEKEASKYK